MTVINIISIVLSLGHFFSSYFHRESSMDRRWTNIEVKFTELDRVRFDNHDNKSRNNSIDNNSRNKSIDDNSSK